MAHGLKPHQIEAIQRYHQKEAAAWVEGFDQRLASILDNWGLDIEAQLDAGFPTNSIFYVKAQGGEQQVLKLGPGADAEILSLSAFPAEKMVEVVASSLAHGALLMTRLEPGYSLRSKIRDSAELHATMPLLASIPVEAATVSMIQDLPKLDDWIRDAFAQFRSTHAKHWFLKSVQRAETLYQKIRQGEPQFLLHGDLHHENILFDRQRGWCVIDPKGVVGPRLMETGRFLHNFLEDESQNEMATVPRSSLDVPIEVQANILEKRIRHAAELLPFSVDQLIRATYVDVVLAACWTLNSKSKADQAIHRVKSVALCLSRF